MIIEKDRDNQKFSSNINEVIQAVLNFFLQKDFTRTKSTKAVKALKALNGTKTLGQKHKMQIGE